LVLSYDHFVLTEAAWTGGKGRNLGPVVR